MPFIVIEVTTPGVLSQHVRSFGPYGTGEEAEQARRRRHLANVLASAWSPPRTYVAEIEGAI
jgi:hypothetical protein